MNNNRPRTEPWGTPCLSKALGDLELCSEMKYCLSVRYEENQDNAEPEMPTSARRESNIL